MTSDIGSLNTKYTPEVGCREAERSLKRMAPRHKSSLRYNREIHYIRDLRSSIQTIRHNLIWLKLTRAPDLKIEKLETKLKKRQAKLAFVTKAVGTGWHQAGRDKVRSYQKNRFYWLGVTAFRNDKRNKKKEAKRVNRPNDKKVVESNIKRRQKWNDFKPTKNRRKARYFILRDNWGTKQIPNFYLPPRRRRPARQEIEQRRGPVLPYDDKDTRL